METAFSVEWRAPEFLFRAKTVSWFWVSIIIAVLLLGAAVWQRNFLFGFFVVVAEMLVLFWGNRHPDPVPFRLTEKGLTIHDRTFYPFTDIESFGVDDEADEVWKIIEFRFRRRFRPVLMFYVPENRLSEIVSHMSQRIPQHEWDDSFVDSLEKFFGF